MPEAEICLRYRDLPVAVAYRLLAVSCPVLLVFLVWSLLCLVMALTEGRIQAGPTSIVVLGECTIVALASISLFLSSDQVIFITRDGISLPFVVSPCLGLRAQRKWSQLTGVRFARGSAGGGTLTLIFRHWPPVRFNLSRLGGKDVEDLIVAVDVWAGGSDFFPALLEARASMQGTSQTTALPSYTEMWEDELARRFGATNFIPLEPGQKVRDGKYSVERQLAFGGLSAIYLLRDENNEFFVLKEAVVPQGGNESLRAKAQEMLEREAFLLSRLNHPNIARVLDYFVEAERHYLLMEYVRGSDLRKLTREFGPQKEEDVLLWAAQLAEILDYLHTQDPPVIHRDLSPDNLILREDGQIEVIDFGAANLFAGTATGTMIGKHAYIAPEQFRGKAEPASDIYAFGCTVYFLLTGEDPEPLGVSHPRHRQPAVSEKTDELVARCTAMEPQDRPRAAGVLKQQLKSISGGHRA